MKNVLAFDFGGGSLRGALVGRHGDILAAASRSSNVGRVAECDPVDWWNALAALCDELASSEPGAFDDAGAIAISAFTRTQVFLDTGGSPTRDAPTWHDVRAGAIVDELRSIAPADHPEYARLNAFHPVARALWFARAEPAAFARTAHVVEPKDYLNFRLTGRLIGDTVASARLAAAAAAGPDGRSVLATLGFSPSLVVPLQAPDSVVYPVKAGLPGALGRLAGRPVVAMANDTWAAVAGLGALRVGAAYNISGTSEVFGIVSGVPAVAEGLLDVVWGEGLHQLGGPGQNGADALAWAIDLIGRNRADVGEELARAVDGPLPTAPLLFLPYLQGERTPFWDADLRGALLGLGRGHTGLEVVRAVMEGVAFVNRTVLERAELAAGMRTSEIRFGGGGASSAAWCRIKADVLGREIAALPGEEAGLAGAAIVARAACGEYPSLAAAQQALARPARRWTPDPARATHYDRLYAVFRQAHDATAPISRRLATWTEDRR